jgi:hypothetical protein
MQMDDSFFRVLNKDEDVEMRRWARENYTPGDEINPLWHPVVRYECERINEDLAQKGEDRYLRGE